MQTFSILENMKLVMEYVRNTVGSSSYIKQFYRLYESKCIDAEALWEGV